MVAIENKCLNPNCQNPSRARGLCRNCYGIAFGLVKRGKTTWRNLERTGKAKPAARSRFSEWLKT